MRLYITKNVFLKLDDGLILKILENLNLIDIVKMMLVCKQLQNICILPKLWKTLFVRSFGIETAPPRLIEVQKPEGENVNQNTEQGWYDAFKERVGQYVRPANKKRILNGQSVPTVAAEKEIYETIMAMGFEKEAALGFDSLQQAAEGILSGSDSMEIPKEEELNEKFVKDFLSPRNFEGETFGMGDVDMVDQTDFQDTISMLTSMGYTEKQAKVALKKNGYNLELAAEWLVTHPDYNFDL